MLKEIFESYAKKHVSSGKFSISSVGGCLRKKYLEIKGQFKEDYNTKSLRAFDLGDLYHKQMLKEIMEKGEQFGFHVASAEVNIPEQKYISGRTDIILSDSKTGELLIVDCKSASDWTFNKVREGDLSYIQNYILQIQLYLHFFKLSRGFLLFMSKSRGEFEEVEVKYDKALCEQQVQEIENFYENYVNKNIEPPRCNGGNFPCPVCKGLPK